MAAATAKLSRRGATVWLKRLQYGDEGHSDATALVYRRVGGARRLFLTGSATGLMATRQNLLIAEVNADTGAKVHHVAADGNGADDGGRAARGRRVRQRLSRPAGPTDVTSGRPRVRRADVRGRRRWRWTKPIWLGPGDNEAYFRGDRPGRRRQPRLRRLRRAARPRPGGLGPVVLAHGRRPLDQRLERLGLRPSTSAGRSWPDAGGVYAAGQVTRTASGIDAQLKKIEP